MTVLGATTSVGATGVSSLLDGTEGDLTDADADVINDFMTGDDSITFGLAAGDGTIGGNYDEAAYEDTFAAAQAAADAAFLANAGLVYFLTGTNDIGDGGAVLAGQDGGATGLLFLNVDGDTNADAVLSLTGITAANFGADDII